MAIHFLHTPKSVTSVMSVMSVKVNFEMGEKSSRIYIIKIKLFLLYIYVSSKKGELKIEFDTHDTRDTHDYFCDCNWLIITILRKRSNAS